MSNLCRAGLAGLARLLVLSCAMFAGKAAWSDELTVSIDLPEDIEWTLASEQLAGPAYSREWVPVGEHPDTASWLIAQQKVAIDDYDDAAEFLGMINELSAEACTSATHNDIEHKRIDGERAAIGRTLCGRRLGTDYGVFADRAIIIEDGFAYIVTSELRIPPMIVDGVLSFGDASDPQALAAKEAFTNRDTWSRRLVRDHVHIE